MPLWIYIALGAAIAWSKLGRDDIRPFLLPALLDPVLDRLNVTDEKSRHAVEFVIFVAIGVLVADALLGPSTGGQAIAAGLGWTAMLSGLPNRSPQ